MPRQRNGKARRYRMAENRLAGTPVMRPALEGEWVKHEQYLAEIRALEDRIRTDGVRG
jgi:hypothetical protein